MNTDLSVFTNKDEVRLSDRLNSVLHNSLYFDVLVGYFRITGFYLLHKQMEDIKEVRILIGLGADPETLHSIDLFEVSGAKAFEFLKQDVKAEFSNSDNSSEVEQGVNVFINWVKTGKVKVRMCYDRNVHAKVYIVRKDPEKVPDQFGNLITGSSNFSYSGLHKNIEFNVELKNRSDVQYALDFFNELWNQSRDISEDLISIVNNETWMIDTISPYEMFLRALYVYFEEEIGDNVLNIELPEDFMKLEYQEHAVIQARKMLERHGGVFISDVVGLGKTYIAAMLGKLLKGRKLFIVPPVVKDYWESVLTDFSFVKTDTVVSLGMIDQIVNWHDIDNYSYVFIDEAHRFRNADSQTYQYLKEICYGKKVILITATPQNNTIRDIANLITLFQDARKSSIMPNCPDLDAYFKNLVRLVKESKKTDEYEIVISQVAERIRNDILRHVMVRRTRSEIKKFYSDDIKNQGLMFPKVNDPVKLTYEYSPDMEKAFLRTIKLLKELTYARYTPLLFAKDQKAYAEKKSGQQNLKAFIKTMLVKRLESSIYAFVESLKRLKQNSKDFIDFFERGYVIIGAMSQSNKINVDKLLMMTDDEVEQLVYEKDVTRLKKDEFVDEYSQIIRKDDMILSQLIKIWDHFNIYNDDEKFDILLETIKNENKETKIIVFSEAKDTVEHIEDKLSKYYPNEVISFSGSDSIYKKEIIEANFDPNYKGLKLNDKRILIATDALSEGVNLHRASVLVNYDLPWNPTRVMQRLGRINRVGSEFDNIFIYNFFPSTSSKEYLSLEDAIKYKIQLFNQLLGSDQKLLTDEDVTSEFGLYDILMMTQTLPDEEEMTESATKMEYLQIINKLRKENIDMFDKIKNLPNKIKVARFYDYSSLLTFIKKGLIKRFYLCDGEEDPNEIIFEDAMKILETTLETKKTKLPEAYYKLLEKNYQKFILQMKEEINLDIKGAKLSRNENQVRNTIKFILKQEVLTYKEKEYFKNVQKAISYGRLDNLIFKNVVKSLESNSNDLKSMILAFKDNISSVFLTERKSYNIKDSRSENDTIVLSEYLIKG